MRRIEIHFKAARVGGKGRNGEMLTEDLLRRLARREPNRFRFREETGELLLKVRLTRAPKVTSGELEEMRRALVSLKRIVRFRKERRVA